MQIGTQYKDYKMYRGIEHHDGLPLSSGDMHEYADTLQKKMELFSKNLIGSGLLNNPGCRILDNGGVSLKEPAAILLDGDVMLIDSDQGSAILKNESISVSSGVLCVVGWYQRLDIHSTLRYYGGVNNSILDEQIKAPAPLNKEISKRYQFRWDTVVIDTSTFYSEDDITFNLQKRENTGEPIAGETLSITTSKKIGNVRVAEANIGFEIYSPLYIIPLIEFNYNSSTNSITTAKTVSPLKLVSRLEESVYSTTVTKGESKNYKIGTTLGENDLLLVTYDGLVLSEGVHYIILSSRDTITLNVDSEGGETLECRITRIL